ncbi:MAG: serine/threonine transporter SstT [Bacteroidaceae bacterium]
MNPKQLLRRLANTSLVTRIIAGLMVGILLGVFVPSLTWIGLFGQLFVGALKAVAPVLVAVLVVASVARAGGGLGSRFRTVIVCYLSSTVLAAVCAVVGCRLFPVRLELVGGVGGSAPDDMGEILTSLLVRLVDNPIAAVAEANYIGILFWSVLVGLALKVCARPSVINQVADWAEVVSVVVRWVIRCAPLGIMGLVFTSVSSGGLTVFVTYSRLLLLLVGCMLVSVLLINPLLSYLWCRRNPYPLLFRCLRESGVAAFFTRSSAANIPINMHLCRSLDLDREFYSVSIPLGATVNMNGAAVTITVMALSVAHTVGVDVDFMTSLLLSVVATLAACGTSGVAGGSMLLVPMACSLFGVDADVSMQAVGIGFIIGVVQDSVETASNSSADVFFTATAEYAEQRRRSRA